MVLPTHRWDNPHRPDLPRDKLAHGARVVVGARTKGAAFEALRLAMGDGVHVRHDRVEKSEDPREVAATTASPGVVLWRPARSSGARFVRWPEPWQAALDRARTCWEVYALRRAAKFEEGGADEEAQALRDDVASGILTEGDFREVIGAAIFRDVADTTFRRRVTIAVAKARKLRGLSVLIEGEAPLWLDRAEREATALLFEIAAEQARAGALGQADRWARLGLQRVSADEETFREALTAGGVATGKIQRVVEQVYVRAASK